MAGGPNLIEIIVSAVNDTKAGFGEAKAGAAEAAAGFDDEAAAADRAAGANDRLAESQAASADSAKKTADAQEGAGAKTEESGLLAAGAGKKLRDLALGAGAVAVGAIYMGAKFQEGATQLVTGAGQSAAGLKQVETGMLAVSTQTATSSKDVEAGMYLIESAGFHGAQGLQVLKAAAEGAKVGNAQLADVANVVTSALNAYHLPASQAVAVTDQLVATVASGKMHMQDLASSISNVLPVAASAHISLAQVGGAMATMTMQGMSARRASMNLANMLRAIVAPSAASAKEMQALGLNANTLSQNIGKVGLTGTLQEMTDAILKNTSGGSVMLGYMNQMTPAAQGLAREILAGSISTKDLTTATGALSPEQAALVKAFETSATSATGLKQTFDGAMKAMVGGATGLNVALLLGGKHAQEFAGNVDTVGKAAQNSGPDVSHWGDITGDTAFKLDQAKVSVENMGISIGMALLPALDKILGPLSAFLAWISQSKVAVDLLAGTIAGALAGFAVVKAVEGFQKLSSAFGAISSGITALATKFGILGAAQDEEAISAEGATVAEEGLNAAFLANPVTAIIAVLALLVVAFIELWKHSAAFRDFWKGAWKDIKDAAVEAWHFIDDDMIHPLMAGIGDLVSWIGGHWRLLATILATVLLGPVGGLIAFIATHWAEFRSLTGRLITDVVGFFERLPGQILHALSSLGSLLYTLGRNIIEGLIRGIESMVGSVLGTIGRLGSDIGGAFSSVLHMFSPSKVFEEHGRNIVRGLVNGINAEGPSALNAIRNLGMGLGPGGSGGGYGGGGVLRLEVTGSGGGLDHLFITWLKNQVRVLGGGGPNSVQLALGRTV